MKNTHLVLSGLLAFGFCGNVAAESLVLAGVYQGKDLYVKNPFADDGAGFCVFEVLVNGELSRDEINSSAFAIDFNVMGIKVGSRVEIVLNHKDGCNPLVLNPEAIKPHSTFNIIDIKVERGILNWAVDSELGSLPYVVEQFRWNKWIKAGEVMGEGSPGKHSYKFELTPYSGENKVRVRQTDYTGKPRYSQQVMYQSSVAKVTFDDKKITNELFFSAPTRYEVFDRFGNLVKTGFGKSISVSNLEKGVDYYVNYDNSFGETFRKR